MPAMRALYTAQPIIIETAAQSFTLHAMFTRKVARGVCALESSSSYTSFNHFCLFREFSGVPVTWEKNDQQYT